MSGSPPSSNWHPNYTPIIYEDSLSILEIQGQNGEAWGRRVESLVAKFCGLKKEDRERRI
jgi:hypothetical protein